MSFLLKPAFLLAFFTSFSLQCTNTNFPFENYLASKTPYRVVGNRSFTEIKYPGCTPLKVYMLVRHGTRNPSISQIEEMRNRLPEIRNQVLKNVQPCEQIHNRDLDLFRKWKTYLDGDDEKTLTHEGEEEMLILAERMQSRFPKIFSTIYSNSTYRFKYTHTQRTKKSALYFALGLFGRNTAKDVWFPKPLKQDPILRFYKLCNKWRTNIKKNPQALKELINFQKSDIMNKTIAEVNQRLGTTGLDLGDLHSMYMICAFETAWNKKTKSPWCSPFTVDNLKVMEYAEDLKFYWVDGYGHELTYKQACPVFGDLMNFFESGTAHPKSVVYFTHSGTLLKVLAHLGLYKEDQHLTADNFEQKVDDRKWRVSLIDSFGTNLAFVLFDCNGEKKVLTLHQENIVQLPSCRKTDLCHIKSLKQYYTESLHTCDFNAMCDVKKL